MATFTIDVKDTGDTDENLGNLARLPNGNLIATWYQNASVPGVSGRAALRIVGPDGTPVTDEFYADLGGAGANFSPKITVVDDDTFILTYQTQDGAGADAGYDTYGRVITLSGSTLTASDAVLLASGSQMHSSYDVALTEDGHLVLAVDHSYSLGDSVTSAAAVKIFDTDLNAINQGGTVGTAPWVIGAADATNPLLFKLATKGDKVWVSWQDFATVGANHHEMVYGSTFTLDGAGQIGDTLSAEILLRDGEAVGNAKPWVGNDGLVALASGKVALLSIGSPQTADGATNKGNLFVQIFDPTLGQKLGAEIQVNPYEAQHPIFGADIVALDGGGFAVFWVMQPNEVETENNTEVWYQVYDRDFAPSGSPVKLTTTSAPELELDVSAVITGEGGDFAVLVEHKTDTLGEHDLTVYTVDDLDPDPVYVAPPDLVATSDTGVSDIDNITSDTSPTFAGAGNPGDTITLYVGDTPAGTGTVAGDGTWSITITLGAIGTHEISYTSTAPGGQETEKSDTLSLQMIDAQSALEISVTPGTGPIGGTYYSNHDITIEGVAPAYDLVEIFVSGQYVTAVSVGSDGRWSYTPATPADGSFAYMFTGKSGGNPPVFLTAFHVVVDGTSPAAPSVPDLDPASDTGPSDTDNDTDDFTPTFTGTAEPHATVELFLDHLTSMGTTQADGLGNWSFTADWFPRLSHEVSAVATDWSGNVSPPSASLTVTNSAPMPAPSVPDMEASSDSGVSDSDNVTDVEDPVFTGTAEPLSQVELFLNGTTSLGITYADEAGNWSLYSFEIPEGTHEVTAIATDGLGDASPASAPLTITIDDTLLPPSTPQMTALSDTGVSDSDGITRDTTPTYTGTAEPFAAVELYYGSTLAGTDTADESGNWEITANAFPDGTYDVFAQATDAAGNTAKNTTPLQVTLDTQIQTPSKATLDPASNTSTDGTSKYTNTSTPTLTGTAGAGDKIEIFDDSVLIATTQADETGKWSATTSEVSEGSAWVTVRASDAAGNTADGPQTHAFTVDTVLAAPRLEGQAYVEHTFDGPVYTLKGTAEPGALIQLFVVDPADPAQRVFLPATTTASSGWGAGSAWELDVSGLVDGDYQVGVQATDRAGNQRVSDNVIALTLDTFVATPSAPDLLDAFDTGSSSTDDITSSDLLTFSGTVEPEAEVFLFKLGTNTSLGSTVAGLDGSYQVQIGSLPEGVYDFYTVVRDVAGNISEDSSPLEVTIDRTAPQKPVVTGISDDTGTSASDGVTSDQTLVISGTAPANTLVELAVLDGSGDPVVLGQAASDATGAWSFDHSATTLPEGTHNFVARTADVAGNSSDFSDVFAVVIDLVPPTPSITGFQPLTGAFSGTTTSDNTPVIAGTAGANATVILYRDGVEIGRTTADGAGNWSLHDQAATLADGDYIYTARSESTAGGQSDLSGGFTATVDTTPPNPARITHISDDDGISDSDAVTSDDTLIFYGTADPFSEIELFKGLWIQGLGTADASGNWSIDLSHITYGEGTHSFTVQAEDAVGNNTGMHSIFQVVIDKGPVAPPSTPAINHDTGPSDSDGITAYANLIFSGTSPANTIVEVMIDGQVIGSTRADGNGNWSFDHTGTTLPDGAYSVTARTVSAGGAPSDPSGAFALTVDTVVPNIPTVTGVDNAAGPTDPFQPTQDGAVTVRGTADAGERVEVFLDGMSVGITQVDADGDWSLDLTASPLGDGQHLFTARTLDLAGFASKQSHPHAITVDNTAPIIPHATGISQDSGASDTDLITNDTRLEFFGTGEPHSTVELFLEDATHSAFTHVSIGTTTVDASGNWRFDFTGTALHDNEYFLSVKGTDGAGNATDVEASLGFHVVTTAPQAPTLTGYSADTGTSDSDGLTNDATLTITGTGSRNVTVQVFNNGVLLGEAKPGAGGIWSLELSPGDLAEGPFNLTARSLDKIGNLSDPTPALTGTLDTTAPAAPAITGVSEDTGVSDSDAITQATGVTVTGTAAAGTGVELFLAGQSLGQTTADAAGNWSLATGPNALTEGTHALTAQAIDSAGNNSNLSTPFPLVVDRTSPSLDFGLGDMVAQGGVQQGVTVSADDEQVFAVVTEAGASLKFQLPAGITLREVGSSGTASYFAPVAPFAASFTGDFTAIATDAAGNVTTKVFSYTYNAPPDDIALSSEIASETLAPGDVVARVAVTEGELPSDLSGLVLSQSASGLFALQKGADGSYALVLAAGQSLDYDIAASHSVTLKATDAFGSTYSEDFTIQVREAIDGSGASDALDGTAKSEEIDSGDGDDVVSGGGGADRVTLGRGADTFADTAANFNGNRFTDFQEEDQLVFKTGTLSRDSFSFSPDGTVKVDQDGDGTPDVTFALEGDFSGGDFMAVQKGGETIVTFEEFLPTLADGQKVDASNINGINNQGFLTGDGKTEFLVTLKDMGYALFNNVLGVYEIDENGQILDPRILFANANADKTAQTRIGDVEEGHKLGFFLVQNAASWASGLSPKDVLSFVNTAGDAADLGDGADLILRVGGAAVDELIFHSFAAGMNPTGLQRALSGVEPGGKSIVIGFEDTTNGGDSDYEDVAFSVALVDPVL